jgi:hypothetical protein
LWFGEIWNCDSGVGSFFCNQFGDWCLFFSLSNPSTPCAWSFKKKKTILGVKIMRWIKIATKMIIEGQKK